MPREIGTVLRFEVLNFPEFVAAVLEIPDVEFVALSGYLLRDKWPDGLPAALGRPDINRLEVSDRDLAFRLDADSKSAIREVVLGDSAWNPNHWWAYSTDNMLISCYDWDCGPKFANPSLSTWLDSLSADGVVSIGESVQFTNEWYEQLEREAAE